MTVAPPQPPAAQASRIALLVIVVAGFLVYANSLTVPPQFDDLHVFAEVSPAAMRAKLAQPQRWLAHLTFAANHALHGTEVYGYHLVNVLLHVANGVLLFLLLHRLLTGMHGKDDGRGAATDLKATLAAGAAALAFVLHPLTTQSVTYIAQRYNLLVGFFWLAALLLYLTARDRRAAGAAFAGRTHLPAYVGAVLCGLAAMFCKEFAVALPAVVLLLEWTFPPATPPDWRRRLAYLAPLLLTGLVIPVLHLAILPGAAAGDGGIGAAAALPRWAPEAISRSLYFRTQLMVIVRVYLRLAVLPWGQSIDHHLGAGGPWLSAGTILYGGLLLGLFLTGWRLLRRLPLVGFGILWFFFALAPTSSIITNTEAVAEHRMYVPLMGLAGLAAGLLGRLPRPRRWLPPVLAALALLAGLTVARNRVWQSGVRLWADAAARYPHNPRAWFALGRAYHREARLDDAVRAYGRALDLRPDHAETINNIGLILQETGRFEDAADTYRRALQVNPEHWRAWFNLGLVYNRLGRPADALAATARSLELQPGFAPAHHNLGMAREDLGDPDGAKAAYREALARDPGYLPSHYHLGRLLLDRGEHAAAADHFALIVTRDPAFADARDWLRRAREAAALQDSP